jgi:hypothetical protein
MALWGKSRLVAAWRVICHEVSMASYLRYFEQSAETAANGTARGQDALEAREFRVITMGYTLSCLSCLIPCIFFN